ncbi:MAG: hypothetical protein ACO25D_09765 [Burkholderiaceae bacterium]|jgi:hypothetical protein
MSENIVITNGINKPWELQGTNYDKPEEIVLANLAVGQLAFLGSAFGKYLSTQATVTAELASAVNRVRDRSAEVASLFQSWFTNAPKLDLSMTDVSSTAGGGEFNLADQSLTPIDKLVNANNLLDQYGIADKFIKDISAVIPGNAFFPCTYTFGPTEDNKIINAFSSVFSFKTSPGMTFNDYTVFFKLKPEGGFDTTKPFVYWKGAEYEVSNIKPMWVPQSQADIDFVNTQLSYANQINKSLPLLDKTQLVPVPSELNSDPSSGENSSQQPVVTMEISLAPTDYFLQFKLDTGEYYYYDKPESQIPLFDETTFSSNIGSVVKRNDGSYWYIRKYEDYLGFEYGPIRVDPPKIGVKDLTNLQKSEILSQYSDKVVRITQRSSEQTTYVNALTQRYNYFYEAATNILKAFTNLWSSLVSNV